MLYYLHDLKNVFSPLNVFQYITFRSAGAFLSALGISLLIGPAVIRWLKSRGSWESRARKFSLLEII